MFKEYEEYIELLIDEGKSKHTIRSYSKSLEDFFSVIEIISLDSFASLTIGDYNRYQQSLQKRDYSKDVVKLKMSHVKGFARYLYGFGYIKNIPDFRQVRPVRVRNSNKEVVILTEKEVEQVLSAPVRLQYQIQIRLMLDVGLRNEETTILKVENIVREDDGRCFLEFIGKGSKDARLPLNEELCGMISEYLSTKKDVEHNHCLMSLSGASRLSKKPIRTSAVWQRVRKTLLASGIPEERVKRLSPHSFRKTFVSRLANSKNFSVHQVMHLARHSNISVTQRYIRVREDEANEKLLASQGSKS